MHTTQLPMPPSPPLNARARSSECIPALSTWIGKTVTNLATPKNKQYKQQRYSLMQYSKSITKRNILPLKHFVVSTRSLYLSLFDSASSLFYVLANRLCMCIILLAVSFQTEQSLQNEIMAMVTEQSTKTCFPHLWRPWPIHQKLTRNQFDGKVAAAVQKRWVNKRIHISNISVKMWTLTCNISVQMAAKYRRIR